MGPVGAFIGAIFFGVGAGASLAYTIAVGVARIAVLSLAAKLTAPEIDLSQAAHDKLITIRDPVAPQAFVYGQDMLSGPMIFANTTDNVHLDRLIALTGREIDSFVGYRIDDEDIDVGEELAADTGTVQSGKYDGVVTFDNRTGTSTQTAISQLTTSYFDLWTSAHQCRGWSLVFTRMTIQGNNTAFEGGLPQNIRALVKGHKVYDPRLDSTNDGSGSHRLSDESTWEWSDNPALCWADFMRWDRVGLNEEDDRIDWTLLAAAADICDETVAIPTSSTQKRYTCNFTFYSNQDREQVEKIILKSMLGRRVFSQGKWKLWAGAAQTADITLTEANLAGGIQVQASTGSDERYNRVRGKFVDPTRDYTANSYPEQRSATYETADGEVKYKVLDCNACNNSFEAQRAAIITLRQSRNQRVIVFEGNMSCLGVQAGTVVLIDIAELGFDDDKYVVTEWTLRKESVGVNLTMVAEDDDAWDDPLESDYTVRSPTGDLIPPDDDNLNLSGATMHYDDMDPADANWPLYAAFQGVKLLADGSLRYRLPNGVWTEVGVPGDEWMKEQGLYWVKSTVNSGALSAGSDTTGSWLDMDEDREFYIDLDDTSANWQSSSWVGEATEGKDFVAVRSANITIEISDDSAGTNVLKTAVFDMEITKVVHRFTAIDHIISDEGDAVDSIFETDGDLVLENASPAVEADEYYIGAFNNPGGGRFAFRVSAVVGDTVDSIDMVSIGEWFDPGNGTNFAVSGGVDPAVSEFTVQIGDIALVGTSTDDAAKTYYEATFTATYTPP